MINVYSPTETNFKNNGLATLIPISCDFGIGVNDKWQLTMEHPFDKELRYQHLVENAFLRVTGVSCVNELEQDTERFGLNGKVQLYRVFDTKKTLTSVTVIAFPVAFEAVYDTPIESLVIQNKTGIEAGEILDAQTQKYSVSSDITRTASSKYENTNLIGAISGNNDDSYINKWGGEVVYDNYKIKIKNKTGDQNNASAYPIRYGRNLTGLTHEIDMSSVVTRIFPISSDDLRLNVWEDVTSQGGNRYVDSTEHISDYPFIRCMFVEVDYSLLDTNSNSISETATATNGWREGIINAVTAQATALWTSIIQDLTNAYSPEYIQDLINGEDGIVGYLQRKYVYSHKGWQSFVKSCAKQGVEWIKDEALPTWEWHEDTSVIPHAWWYGDNSVDPAVSYAKNEYVKIGKNYEYFNNDGYWEDYKAMPHADCDWYEAKDGSGRKWFGYRKGYYAHNEYVYMTVEGQMKEWWYDEEGWYDESRSGDSDMGWHGDATSGYWFGESDATSEDTNKFLHDRWAWIDGNYYWFDKYGYISGELDIPDYPWFVIETTQGSWFGNDQDEMLGAKWFANQWAKIDGEWYYFDADGYVVDMTAKKSETIAWFANTVYNNTIEYITTCLTNAYILLYRLMTEWCEKQYADGIDLPTVNVSVDLIDLSKTTEYKDYSNLEKISLGDKVLVIGRDGSRYEERVVGLTFDCIRGYNTQIEVGQLSKSVSQIINVSYSGASEGQKIIAGDGVTIDGKVISVGDYVGRTIGLQDVLLNGSTTVSGNVASFGIQAGENISISRDGNTLTISGEGGGSNIYYGTSEPAASLGVDRDLYLQLNGSVYLLKHKSNSTGIQQQSLTFNGNKATIQLGGTPTRNTNDRYTSYQMSGLTTGQTYIFTFDIQINGFIDGHSQLWSDVELRQVGVGTYFFKQIFEKNDHKQTYNLSFVAPAENIIIAWEFADLGDDIPVTIDITNLSFGIDYATIGGGIIDIYGKVGNIWEKDAFGGSYTAGTNIDITNNVISAPVMTGATANADGASGTVPQPLIADKDKVLKGDGTWGTAGADVSITPSLQSGSKVAEYEINGEVGVLYSLTNTTGDYYNPIIYSETEREIGVWIDNKPLYQITIVVNSTTKGSITVDVSNLNIADFVGYGGIWDRSDGNHTYWMYFGDYINSEISSRVTYDQNIKSIYLARNARNNETISKAKVTLYYTKTTDVAGSGSYNTLGVPTVHYSTDEQVIGTWMGETLYQKCVATGGSVPSGATLVERTAMASTGYDTIKYIK